MTRKGVYILFFLFFTTLLLAQSLEDNLYLVNDIRAHNIESINEICEDSEGYLWLATDNGLFIFDGNTIRKNEKIPEDFQDSDFQNIYADSHNRIWAGTMTKGLLSIDLAIDSVTVFAHSKSNKNSIADNRTKLIWEDYHKRIWIATHTTGLNLYLEKQNSFDHYLPSSSFSERNKRNIDDAISHSSDPNRKNIEWIGTVDGLLALDVDKLRFSLYYCTPNNLKFNQSFNGLENEARSILLGDNELILGTWGGGICKIDTATNMWDCYKPQIAYPASHNRNNISKIIRNNKGNIIINYLENTHSYNIVDNKKKIISEKRMSEYFNDSKNQEWYVLDRKHLYVKTDKSQLTNSYHIGVLSSTIYYDNQSNKIYTGQTNRSSIAITDADTYFTKTIAYTPENNTGYNFVKSIFKNKKGNILFHDNRDLYILDDDKRIKQYINIKDYKPPFKDGFNAILKVYMDNEEELWFGDKSSGIMQINTQDKSSKFYNSKTGMDHVGWVGEFYEDSKGNIWYGTEKSLGYINKSNNTCSNIADPEISFSTVEDIIESKENNIWFSQENQGLFRISNITDGKYQIDNFELPNLQGESARLLKIDIRENIWGYTEKVLFQFNTTDNTFTQWGREYGLSGISSACFIKDNILLFGIGKTLNTANIDSLRSITNNPTIKFNILKVFNKHYSGLRQSISSTDRINLSYKESFFSVGFSLFELLETRSLQFEYKMEGLYDNWIQLGKRNYIEFPSLSPGKYQLQIRHPTTHNKYVYSKKLSIIIIPPYWNTLWFKLSGLCILAFLTHLYLERKRRKTRMKWKEKLQFEHQLANVEMSALKSQMNPHFIFNCLNSIKLYILENDQEKASRYISDFSKLLRLALNNSRIDLISLDKEIEAVKLYIELEKMRFIDKFTYSIIISPSIVLHDYMVPPLMIQPFVENSLIHGILPLKSSGKLTIEVNKKDLMIIYTITDNGVGRKVASINKPPQTENQSLATSITKERLKLIKTLYGMEASIEIFDLIQEEKALGTKVIIKIPATYL